MSGEQTSANANAIELAQARHDAYIATLKAQRNEAMDQTADMTAQNAALNAVIAKLQARVVELREQVDRVTQDLNIARTETQRVRELHATVVADLEVQLMDAKAPKPTSLPKVVVKRAQRKTAPKQ